MECREIRLERPWPPNQVKARRFVVYDVYDPPDVPFEAHTIRVVGLVERPLEMPLRELAARYPCVDLVAPFHCVTGWSIERVVWRGVQTKALLEDARPYGPFALAWGADGYSATLPLEALMEETSVIAWAMNGEPLPKKHGAPARLVVPTRYAWKSVKYFAALEVLEGPVPGYWEASGYSINADPWREERFDFGSPQMRGRRTSF
ncbi:oxidoreductase, molybdopterin binding protein [Thermoproteus uzoniensis 768-20]|uniref:Oxidoreductase, molybdopterin binding protein n=1 Tax=Thermoproteus uzoniensis (strain 768-20) TaxID=999630 RepID=F2L690_THEU7|nr:molybdopterin-dependent oxidoreductase [Thermoproteus uzoniensis]AEA12486.1 oxidoreductase, molybdopterin binding protein [Thermoproteus uzoniensis 768-20]